MIDVDLFAGAGGASLGLASLGFDPVGVEWNRDAARTHAAAGFPTVVADVASYPWRHLAGNVRVMHGSPPCQPYSAAGDGVGADDPRDGMPWMLRAVEECRPRLVTMENVPGLRQAKHRRHLGAFVTRLAVLDYRVEYRVLNSADYGVPQCRRRLILVAVLDGYVRWPRRTHSEGGTFGLPRWVSMAEALGWPAEWEVEPVQRGAGMVARHGERPTWSTDGPAPTVTGGDKRGNRWRLHAGAQSRSTVRDVDDPAPTVALGNAAADWQWRLNTGRDWKEGGDRSTAQTRTVDRPAPTVSAVPGQWAYERPATTITADPRVFPPGSHIAYDGRDLTKAVGRSADVVRVPLEDLATLQGFPPGYPFQGNRSSIARQIGNALPPPLLAAVIRANLRAVT